MSSWLIDEALPATAQGIQPEAAPAGWAGTSTPFLTQIEQVLGEETEPDAAFFMDSWTVGVAAASQNFVRRQQEAKSRQDDMPAWDNFSSFTPYFVARVEAPVDASWPLREARAEQSSVAERHARGDEDEVWRAADETATASPLTLDSACRLLGVTAMSTREQVRAAYRKMASRYHPDRLARRGDREQKLAGDRMASINEAYRLLCTGFAG